MDCRSCYGERRDYSCYKASKEYGFCEHYVLMVKQESFLKEERKESELELKVKENAQR